MGFYRFVGGNSEVGELGFDHVGQRAEFSDELFSEVIQGGAAFIPEADFEKVFTGLEKDILQARDGFESEVFKEALTTARELVRNTRALLVAGVPPQIT